MQINSEVDILERLVTEETSLNSHNSAFQHTLISRILQFTSANESLFQNNYEIVSEF